MYDHSDHISIGSSFGVGSTFSSAYVTVRALQYLYYSAGIARVLFTSPFFLYININSQASRMLFWMCVLKVSERSEWL